MCDPTASVVGSNDQPGRPFACATIPGGVMDVDPSWSFDDYQAYERARLDESLAEQARAQADGLEVDPQVRATWRLPHRMRVARPGHQRGVRSVSPAGRSAARDPRL